MTWLTARRMGIIVAMALVAGLIKFLPANIFEARINVALPSPWSAAVSGTVWDGHGVLRAGQSAEALRIPLTWKFDLAALLGLTASWELASTSSAISGTTNLGIGWSALNLRNAALTFDAGALAPHHPLLALAAPSGSIQVSTPNGKTLVLHTRDTFRLNGELHVAATAFSVRPLSGNLSGDYTAKLSAQDARVSYTVRQRKGALNLDGNGSIDMASRGLSYSGLIAPSPELPEAMLQQLKSIGKAAPDGRLRLDWTTQW